jgi:hypothetical protein
MDPEFCCYLNMGFIQYDDYTWLGVTRSQRESVGAVLASNLQVPGLPEAAQCWASALALHGFWIGTARAIDRSTRIAEVRPSCRYLPHGAGGS